VEKRPRAAEENKMRTARRRWLEDQTFERSQNRAGGRWGGPQAWAWAEEELAVAAAPFGGLLTLQAIIYATNVFERKNDLSGGNLAFTAAV